MGDLNKKQPALATDDHASGMDMNFNGIFDGNASWVHSNQAMQIGYDLCIELDVKFVHGDSGMVKDLLFDSINSSETVTGVKCVDGQKWM